MKDLNNWEEKFEICIYAKKLLDKVIYLNSVVKVPSVDVLEVKKAIYYARKYHGNQMRQSGEPFYSHPIEVAYLISDYLFRTDILVTSILHDTIEDTELTKEKISQEFGWKVANQVMDLTRIKEDGIKISAAEAVEILYKEKKHDVLLIKLFDRLHNMQTIGAKSPEKVKKIVEETMYYFLVLSKYLELLDIKVNLIKLCSATLTIPNYFLDHYHLFSLDNYQLPFQVFQNDIDQKYILQLKELL
ncbi:MULTISPECIES: HD domain-containing protein [Rickettsia]|uniref:GTP pyrophosphokinase rsh n=1 Tax=Rickettsia tamurae subsp. buchneri TaxID=1462938 RepID=A0A8E0WM40_9RICK|nr:MULTISPECIES: HD domain-containing protein [spotted fever group]AKS10430.1 GTP pyrophosphokinase rsh [Rickettsia endosymbiont of Ixodes pacificus]EER21403.1 guanosine polyphosphate pyrophosphohydrolase/synthetase [Rickettsia endosymbiont of Ixodes scapularis]KDO03178.1 GTP pyrophosphokinase rsh [Rickettsia tamurae subsp. buchneri]KJW02144.1 HD domain protein [Rickettsia endosymbiont of Ixodes pacificus]